MQIVVIFVAKSLKNENVIIHKGMSITMPLRGEDAKMANLYDVIYEHPLFFKILGFHHHHQAAAAAAAAAQAAAAAAFSVPAHQMLQHSHHHHPSLSHLQP